MLLQNLYTSITDRNRSIIAYKSQQNKKTQIRIGHRHLTRSFLTFKKPALTYETCKENISIDRIVIKCQQYVETRTIFTNSISIQLVLCKENTEPIYQFHHNINLSHKIEIFVNNMFW